jgi:hypothetical protein
MSRQSLVLTFTFAVAKNPAPPSTEIGRGMIRIDCIESAVQAYNDPHGVVLNTYNGGDTYLQSVAQPAVFVEGIGRIISQGWPGRHGVVRIPDVEWVGMQAEWPPKKKPTWIPEPIREDSLEFQAAQTAGVEPPSHDEKAEIFKTAEIIGGGDTPQRDIGAMLAMIPPSIESIPPDFLPYSANMI